MFQATHPVNKKYYSFKNFPGPNLLSVFSLRAAGNMSLFYGDTATALENRKSFFDALGVDCQDLVCARQVHAGNVRHIEEFDKGSGALSCANAITDTDALITDKKNVPLSIFTADCLSIFLYDAKTHSIGLIHAGWRSSKENIVANTIKLMQDKFNVKAKNLYVAFGPAIRDCCYEVGSDFADFFPGGGLIRREGRYYLDLVGINKSGLLACGLQEKNIFDPRICTACHNVDFYSYRKEGAGCGRIMSVMMLK